MFSQERQKYSDTGICVSWFLLTLDPWSLLSGMTSIDFSRQSYRAIIGFCIWRDLSCKRSGFSKAALSFSLPLVSLRFS